MNSTLHSNIGKYYKVAKFIIVGGTSAITAITILFLLTHFLHVWYLLSSGIAFLFAFFVSFLLQKFWTFGDRGMETITKQLFSYSVIILCNLTLNTTALYLLVEYAHLHYVVAQIIVGGIISIMSYFFYERYIFSSHKS